jgi:hypothetical protein
VEHQEPFDQRYVIITLPYHQSDHNYNVCTGKGTGRMLVSQLCDASLKSQCPSEVCRACYEANPRALWLAWLKCINTERHQNPNTVTVVVGKDKSQTRSSREKRLLIVRSLPSTYTQLDQVRLCDSGREGCSCLRAHSEEEMLYWKWQVARNTIFSKVSFYINMIVLLILILHWYFSIPTIC